MPTIAQRVQEQQRLGLKASVAAAPAPAGSFAAAPIPVLLQGLIPEGDMAEGYAAGAYPKSPIFTPIFRPQPVAIVQPNAIAKVQTSATGVKVGGGNSLPAPTTPAANFAATATGTAGGVVVNWTPPAQNGADPSGALLENLTGFQVLRGPKGAGIGGASVISTVTSSATPGNYSFTDANGLTDQFDYFVRPVTSAGPVNGTLAVNATAAVSSVQVPPTGSSGSGTGQILAININAPGVSYALGDTIDITGGGGSGATVMVTALDPFGSGAVAGVALVAGGLGYSTGTNLATSGGSGHSFTVDITAVA